MKHVLMTLACAVVVAACADTPQGPHDYSSDQYPLDNQLRINHIQAKGTHNSYHQRPQDPADDSHEYDMPSLYDQAQLYGIRQFELDVYLDAQDGFQVYHLPLIDDQTSCLQMSDCLQQLKQWSDEHPGHHVLFVWVEIKTPFDSERIEDWEAFDQAVMDVWPRDRILTPADVMGDHSNLRGAIQTDGWPVMGAARNKIMLMLNNQDLAEDYTNNFARMRERIMFVRGAFDSNHVAIAKHVSAEQMQQYLEAGLIVGDNAGTAGSSVTDSIAAAESGYALGNHFLATDYPAEVTDYDFVLALEGGQPSRCNPKTAPAICTSRDIEDVQ